MPIPERSAGREKTLKAASRTQIIPAPVEQSSRLESADIVEKLGVAGVASA
jgi:hypothetical protein